MNSVKSWVDKAYKPAKHDAMEPDFFCEHCVNKERESVAGILETIMDETTCEGSWRDDVKRLVELMRK